MVIENKYNIGDIVYLVTDEEQLERMVFAIIVFKSELLYKLCCGTHTSDHYDFEMSKKINVLKKINS